MSYLFRFHATPQLFDVSINSQQKIVEQVVSFSAVFFFSQCDVLFVVAISVPQISPVGSHVKLVERVLISKKTLLFPQGF